MPSRALSLYHRLPPPARSAVATVRGYYLRSWRYDGTTERLVEEAHERDRWAPPQWQRYREDRLARVLHRAATRVPYYREQWDERRRRGDRASPEYLENWPVLDKGPLRASPEAFVADDCDRSRMFADHTSGTSGTSLTLWFSRENVIRWYALFEARSRRWFGVSRHDRWGIIGGQLVVPQAQRRPPFWVWNGGLHQLYMSSYHLAPDLIPHYLDALVQHRVRYLYGYSSALHALAQGALREGRSDLEMRVAITNAEPLFDYQRQDIAAAFHCPVQQTYGMAELVSAASDCEAGRSHLWADVGVSEILQDDNTVPAATGTPGRLVCTGLLNDDMCLIRYQVGDRAVAAGPSSACTCGRTLPDAPAIEGRLDEVLYTIDGRPIGRLDPVFKSALPIMEAQIVQEALDRVRVRFVPAPGYTAAAGASLTREIQARLGAVEVVLEEVDEVPRTAQGKFRAVVCNLSAAERQTVGAR